MKNQSFDPLGHIKISVSDSVFFTDPDGVKLEFAFY